MTKNDPSSRLPVAILSLLAVACIVLVASCGKVSAPGKSVPLTLRAGGMPSSLMSMATMGLTSGSVCDAPVTYSKVLLVVRDVRFRLAENEGDDSQGDEDGDDVRSGVIKPASLDGHDGDGEDEDDDDQGDHGEHVAPVVFRGPFVVDLLTHTADSLDTQMVPPGDYRSIKGHVAPLEANDWNASDFTFLVGSTVYLQGTVEGEGGGDFTYQAPIRHTFKIKGKFTVAESTPATAFLVFDTSQWLCSRDGTFLDPRDPANDAAIQRAIIRSIRFGMDDNHDGKCDDRTHGEGD